MSQASAIMRSLSSRLEITEKVRRCLRFQLNSYVEEERVLALTLLLTSNVESLTTNFQSYYIHNTKNNPFRRLYNIAQEYPSAVNFLPRLRSLTVTDVCECSLPSTAGAGPAFPNFAALDMLIASACLRLVFDVEDFTSEEKHEIQTDHFTCGFTELVVRCDEEGSPHLHLAVAFGLLAKELHTLTLDEDLFFNSVGTPSLDLIDLWSCCDDLTTITMSRIYHHHMQTRWGLHAFYDSAGRFDYGQVGIFWQINFESLEVLQRLVVPVNFVANYDRNRVVAWQEVLLKLPLSLEVLEIHNSRSYVKLSLKERVIQKASMCTKPKEAWSEG